MSDAEQEDIFTWYMGGWGNFLPHDENETCGKSRKNLFSNLFMTLKQMFAPGHFAKTKYNKFWKPDRKFKQVD